MNCPLCGSGPAKDGDGEEYCPVCSSPASAGDSLRLPPEPVSDEELQPLLFGKKLLRYLTSGEMPDPVSKIKREATFEERARWGTCPTCSAPHGTWCYADVGLQVGSKINGARMVDGDGAHVSRLKSAPLLVDNIPA